MKTILYPSKERGYVNHGWLKTYHSFSFGSWYNEKKIRFGMLRVLNDDTIAPGTGFGMHPHDNMEIITILLQGVLEHRDSMGNMGRIQPGEIQAMSAGSGILHSEYNPSTTEETKLFQIWVFPKLKNILPRYEQRRFDVYEQNKFQVVVSPEKNDKTIWINQDAYFSLGNFEKERTVNYTLHRKGNGTYIMVVEGEVEIEGKKLSRRDAIGIYDTDKIFVKINSCNSEILVIEVPMN